MDTKAQKKMILQKLLTLAINSTTGRGLEATVDGIKKAIGAFKTYAKEWDNIDGVNTSSAQPKSDKLKEGLASTQGMPISQGPPAGAPMPNLQPGPGAGLPPMPGGGAGSGGGVGGMMPPRPQRPPMI